ncbi:MAG: UDP-N-acetylmuramoyl-L-alanine--D-glutamate ligase [Caldisericaceae bacterium]
MKVLVLGARKSGVYASILAKSKGFSVFLSELNDNHETHSFESLLKEHKIPYEIGKHSFDKFKDFDLVVLSPGIPLNSEVVRYLEECGKKIIGELEFANMFASNTEVIAITGTNGKSTTTALTYHIIKDFYPSSVYGGNLGTPYSFLLLENPNPQFAILETSCFQLETIEQYHPKVSVFLNFTEDHLDRYGTMDNYLEAKKRIFLNQTESDFTVLNFDDSTLRELAKDLRPKVYFFSLTNKVDRGAYLLGGEIYFKDSTTSESIKIINRSDIPLLGLHNVENTLAAITASILIGVDINTVAKSIKTFKGLPHRLEFVREVDGITFINDSKSTTPDSTIKALESFDRKVILIAGGSSKNNDFTNLGKMFPQKVKHLILMGKTANEIKEAAIKANFNNFSVVESLRDAILLAKSKASRFDVVLLSPACASFDMFRDFEDRGDQFKEIVNSL